MIAGGKDTLQDTGFGGVVALAFMLLVFVFGFAIFLIMAFVYDSFKNILPR